MKGAVRSAVVAAIVVSMTATALAYTRPRWYSERGIAHPRWPVGENIPVFVNTDPPNRIVSGSRPFKAIRNVFELRSAYTTLRFLPVHASYPESIGFDDMNVVSFKDTPANRSATFGFGAVTWYRFQWVDGEAVLVESDFVFNPLVSFTTNGVGTVDIENLGGHEMIHLMAFEHSPVIASTAYPNIYSNLPNERNLALDDRAAAAFLYPFPDTPARTGSLEGYVRKSGEMPVAGAHVVALQEETGEPAGDISIFEGAWRIDGLPPGRFTVYVEPLDGPAEPSNTLGSGIYPDIDADLDFQTTFAGGNASPTIFEVRGGSETSVGTIEVSSTAEPLNLRRFGRSPVLQASIAISALNVDQGEFFYLTVQGPGVDLVPDDGVRITGTGVEAGTANIMRGSAQGAPYMVLPVKVDSGAPPGVRTIFAESGTHIAALTGAIEVHPLIPRPNLLRNDDMTSVTSIAPWIANLLPLDPTGSDFFPGTGEGVLREYNGSDDDDDMYVPQIDSGFLDPDLEVLTDTTRPLVLYQLDDPGRTLILGKDSGRIVVTYKDAE